jgi:DSF synthase
MSAIAKFETVANFRPHVADERDFLQCTFSSSNLSAYHDSSQNIEWMYMKDGDRGCFTPEMLRVLLAHANTISTQYERNINFVVLASDVPGVFNLGGDLALFRQHIERQDRQALLRYAKACVEGQHAMLTGFGRDITTISLVQGDALGGGFECALAADVVIAERGTHLGFPEILFNLFPGMGAYSILARKVGDALTRKLISSGRLYPAEELYEMGVIDILADSGEGPAAVLEYVRHENRAPNGMRAIRAARDIVNPITLDELMRVTEVWVDASLCLRPRDLRMMERLVKRQAGAMQRKAN